MVWEKTLWEHEERLRKVFLKIGESGLKLNKPKCQIRKWSIVFLEHIISSEGINLILRKLKQSLKCSCQGQLIELQRFLGMVNYLGKFISNLAEHTTQLSNLLKKDVWMTKATIRRNLKFRNHSEPCLKFSIENCQLV